MCRSITACTLKCTTYVSGSDTASSGYSQRSSYTILRCTYLVYPHAQHCKFWVGLSQYFQRLILRAPGNTWIVRGLIQRVLRPQEYSEWLYALFAASHALVEGVFVWAFLQWHPNFICFCVVSLELDWQMPSSIFEVKCCECWTIYYAYQVIFSKWIYIFSLVLD